MPNYLTTKQAAARYKSSKKIGCGREYIWRLAKNGEITGAIQVGKQYLIPADWRMLKQNEVENG